MTTFWQSYRYFLMQTRVVLLSLIFIISGFPLVFFFFLPGMYYSECRLQMAEIDRFQQGTRELALLLGMEDGPGYDVNYLKQILQAPSFQHLLKQNVQGHISADSMLLNLQIHGLERGIRLRAFSPWGKFSHRFLQILLDQLAIYDRMLQQRYYQKVIQKVQQRVGAIAVSESPPNHKSPNLYTLSIEMATLDILLLHSEVQSQLSARFHLQGRKKLDVSEQRLADYLLQLPPSIKQPTPQMFQYNRAFENYEDATNKILNFLKQFDPQLGNTKKWWSAYLTHQLLNRILQRHRKEKMEKLSNSKEFQTVYHYYFTRYYDHWLETKQLELVSYPIQFVPSFQIQEAPGLPRLDMAKMMGFIIIWLCLLVGCLTLLFHRFIQHPPVGFVVRKAQDYLAGFYFVGHISWRKRLFNNRANFIYPNSSSYEMVNHLKMHYDHLSPKIWIVSSLLDGEGKSITTLELAHAFQKIGSRTVLLDLNFIHPKQHHYLKLNNDHGLLDILVDGLAFHKAIQFQAYENVDVITTGSASGFNLSGLQMSRYSELLEYLKVEYDVILLDGFSLKYSVEPLLFLKQADGMLILINPRKHNMESLKLVRYYMALFREKCVGYMLRAAVTS